MKPITKIELAAFADDREEIHIGNSNQCCAGCRRPFNSDRQPARAIRLYPAPAILPVCFQFDICSDCYDLHEVGGADRAGMLAAVVAFCNGEVATQ